MAPCHPLIREGRRPEMGSDGVSEARSLHVRCTELMCVRAGGWEGHLRGALKHLENGRLWDALCRHRHANSWAPHPLHPLPHISSIFHKSISERTDRCPPSPHVQNPPPPGAQRDFKCWPWWEASSRCPLPGPSLWGPGPHNLSIRAHCVCHPPLSGDVGSPDL